MRTGSRTTTGLALTAVAIATLAVYAPSLGGYWLGDDFSNLYRAWSMHRDGRLVGDTLAFFASPVDAVGAFYRPMMMASLSLSYAVFGLDYPGWAASSLLVHLLAAALVYALVRRLAPDAPPAGAILAAALFALHPVPVEGVVWTSARADGWVTVLCLGAFRLWIDADLRPWTRAPVALLLLAIALGFKESAVVFPLQLAVFAVLWPRPLGRSRWVLVLLAAGLAAGFLALRRAITGSTLEAYRGSMAAGIDPLSIAPWWSALFDGRAGLAAAYLLVFMALPLIAIRRGSGPDQRLAVAALLSGLGLLAATWINLGGFADSGEGGRLFHTPLAWWCIGLGVLLAGSPNAGRRARAGVALTGVALLLAIPLTVGSVAQYRHAQDGLRAFAEAVPTVAERHPGLTLMLVPDRLGPVITARNGSGALVMPPLQDRPYLHRVLPTLDARTARRHRELRGGLASRLAAAPPSDVELETLVGLLQAAPPRPPEWVGCWDVDAGEARIRPWPGDLDWEVEAIWRPWIAEIGRECGLSAGRGE